MTSRPVGVIVVPLSELRAGPTASREIASQGSEPAKIRLRPAGVSKTNARRYIIRNDGRPFSSSDTYRQTGRQVGPSRFPGGWQQVANRSPLASRSVERLASEPHCGLCPLYPQKRTSELSREMSALYQ